MLPLILAYKSSSIIDSITSLELLPADSRHPWRRLRWGVWEFTFEKIPGEPAFGWCAAYMKLIGSKQEIAPRLLRKIRRFAAGRSDIKGPYTISHGAELYPDFFNQHFRAGDYDANGIWLGPKPGAVLKAWNVWMGDPSPEAVALYDYRPTDYEINNDIEPDIDSIYNNIEEE
jgi:hypothetical protein